MALLTFHCEVQMYEKRLELEIQRKVAGSVVAAEISDHLNAFSNISRRGTEIVFLTILICFSLHPFSSHLSLLLSLYPSPFLTTSPEYYNAPPTVYLGDAIFPLRSENPVDRWS